jgi:succinate dehydrogenase hydrophobic anchor subunit
MKYIILILASVFLLTGCNQGDNKSVKMIHDTYHKIPTGYTASAAKPKESREAREVAAEKEVQLAKLKSEENLKIAKIEAEAREEVKKIETEALKAKVLAEKEVQLLGQKIRKEIADSREKTTVKTQEKDIHLYKIIAAVVSALILIILLVFYLIHRKNKAIEVKLHEEKLKHEAMMQASAQYHEKMGKMLEIIADESASENIKKELVGILREQNQDQYLITYEQDEQDKENEEDDEEEVQGGGNP